MAARIRLRHQDEVRARIQASQLVNRLTDHALGKLEKPMDASQVSAALGLLRKCVSDLSAIEHTGEVEHRHVTELPDDQLTSIAAGGRAGIAKAAGGEKEPTPVH